MEVSVLFWMVVRKKENIYRMIVYDIEKFHLYKPDGVSKKRWNAGSLIFVFPSLMYVMKLNMTYFEEL